MSAPTLHICHVTSAFFGGTFHSVQQLTNGQARMGYRVSVVHNDKRPLPDRYREQFRPNVRLIPWTVSRNVSPARDLLAQLRLLGILMRLRPTIVHLHSSKAGILGRIAAALLHIPHVYSPRGLSFRRTDVSRAKLALFRSLERWGSALGGTTVTCSRDEDEAVGELGGRHRMIPNGLDLHEIDRMLADAPASRDEDAFHVAICGRISTPRNPELVLRVAEASPSSWRWSWIGDGEQRPLVEGCRRIEILGWHTRAQMLTVLRGADVLFHPSLWEGMPLAVLEAMAAGLPVVASDIIGNRDLVQPWRTGALVDRDSDYLPALHRLAADPVLRARLGNAGRSAVESRHDMARLSYDWIDAYRSELMRSPQSLTIHP